MNRPARNVVWLVSADAGSRFVGFLIMVYLARVLDPSAFGVLNIGLAVLGYLFMVASPGIQILETRNVAAASSTDRERVSGVVSLRMFLAAGLVAGTALCSSFVFRGSAEVRDVVVLYSLSLFPLAIFLDWYFQGKELFGELGLSKLINSAIFGLCVFLLVRSAGDVRMAPLSFLAGNLAASVVLLTRYRARAGRLRLAWKPLIWKKIARENIPVGAAMLCGQSAMNLPPLVIGYVLTTTDVGLYSAAMKLVVLLLLIDRVVNAMFLPVMTRFYVTRTAEIYRFLTVTLKFVIILVAPFAICGIIVAPIAIALVFGEGYRESVTILQVLLGYFALTVINSVFVTTLIGAGRERKYTRMMIIGSLVSAITVLILTPLFGALGAATGVVVGEFATVILMMVSTHALVDTPLAPAIVRPLLACGAMAVSGIILQDLSIAVSLTVALLVFISVLITTGGIARDEIRFLREGVT